MLEARFHPCQKQRDPAFVVVGYVVWERDPAPASGEDGGRGYDDRPLVQPARSLLLQTTPATVLSKLQYLVSVTAPDSYQRLQCLRSQYWSFVRVHAPGASTPAGGA